MPLRRAQPDLRRPKCPDCGRVIDDPLHRAACAHSTAVLDRLLDRLCTNGPRLPEGPVRHLYDALLGLYGTDYQRAAGAVYLLVDLGWRP